MPAMPSVDGSSVKDQAQLITQALNSVAIATAALRFQNRQSTASQNTGTSHENSQLTEARIGGRNDAKPIATAPRTMSAMRVTRRISNSAASGRYSRL